MPTVRKIAIVLVLAAAPILRAQPSANTTQIMDRLARLEQQNAELIEEVRLLRTQVNALQGKTPPAAAAAEQPAATSETSPASTEDALAVQQARIDEQEQSKVEAAHKLPLRITGMVLFNAFDNTNVYAGPYSGTPGSAPYGPSAGGTLNQSIIGVDYQSPNTILGGKVHGDLFVDFFGNARYAQTPTGSAGTGSYGEWPMPRLRTGEISLDWGSRTLTVGIDKPLISPLTPDSFAQVAVPALSGAGNFWYWEPQARFEQRVEISDSDTLRLQAALYSTYEPPNYVQPEYAPTLALDRPGWEGRIEFGHRAGDDASFDIAAGFHYSDTHVAGQTVTSDLFSLDGQYRMARWWNLEGTFFGGQDLAALGGAGPGFSIFPDGIARPVHGEGGWVQLTLIPASRLSFHLFGGEQSNRQSDLWGDQIGSSAAFAGNVYYQLAPNVFAAFEAGQMRTDWSLSGHRLHNLYDLSLAYLF
jgi:hypothetical protein